MKVHRQERTSFIAVKERNSEQDAGLIMLSTRSRQTEIDALKYEPLENYKDYVTDKPPGEGYHWCSGCGWRRNDRFNRNIARKSGIDNYCKDCRRRIRLNHVGLTKT